MQHNQSRRRPSNATGFPESQTYALDDSIVQNGNDGGEYACPPSSGTHKCNSSNDERISLQDINAFAPTSRWRNSHLSGISSHPRNSLDTQSRFWHPSRDMPSLTESDTSNAELEDSWNRMGFLEAGSRISKSQTNERDLRQSIQNHNDFEGTKNEDGGVSADIALKFHTHHMAADASKDHEENFRFRYPSRSFPARNEHETNRFDVYPSRGHPIEANSFNCKVPHELPEYFGISDNKIQPIFSAPTRGMPSHFAMGETASHISSSASLPHSRSQSSAALRNNPFWNEEVQPQVSRYHYQRKDPHGPFRESSMRRHHRGDGSDSLRPPTRQKSLERARFLPIREKSLKSSRLPPTREKSFERIILSRKPSYQKLEVMPGTYLRLRGADETWRAIEVDFYMPCECIACNITLFCIQDASFVLCPKCRTISPIEDMIDDNGGVGLGFTIEELARFQKEIEKSR